MCAFACTAEHVGLLTIIQIKFQHRDEYHSTDLIDSQVHVSVKKRQLTFHFIVNVSYDIFPKSILIEYSSCPLFVSLKGK